MRTFYPSPTFYIKDRRGRYLLDPDARPRVWSEHRGIAFRTAESAHRAIDRLFVGHAAARELLGLRVVDR